MIGILILLVVFGLWAKKEKNLGDILDVSKEQIWHVALEKHVSTGSVWESDSVRIEETEDIEVVLQALNEMNVTWKGWSNQSKLSENEECYDVKIFDNGLKWVRIKENGEIRILFMGQWIYHADDMEVKNGIDRIQGILETAQKETEKISLEN